MVTKRLITSIALLATLAATPVFAEDQHRHRAASGGQAQHGQAQHRAGRTVPPAAVERRDRAVPRTNQAVRPPQVRRDLNASRRVYVPRSGYAYPYRGSYAYPYRGRTVVVPRIIRPRIVTVVPYRPYVYRPSLGLGVFYGAGGVYPYGYTPRGYYDPIPGRAYGGLRITDAPRDAQVFADGYYVGIVDDFDGVFQHVNLEAGPHHIEIQEPGVEPIAFDVIVQPGQTVTFRADLPRS